MLIPHSVSHLRPGVRDDQPFQYDTNDWFSIENESLLLCSLAVISLRIPWVMPAGGLPSRLVFLQGLLSLCWSALHRFAIIVLLHCLLAGPRLAETARVMTIESHTLGG